MPVSEKWFEEKLPVESIVISSRVRLARNLKKYKFFSKIDKDASKELINEVKDAVINDRSYLADEYKFIDFNENSTIEKLSLLENHAVSHIFLSLPLEKGLLLRNDERVSIMINEEDHIRLQSLVPGSDIDNAYDLATKIDDFIEESVDYAFSKDFGYLTSCPTNVGTGMRASFMIHIPALSQTGQVSMITNAINKFGMTIRGIFGEGTEPGGDIYQISNQITLGKSEEDIINSLKQITNQIIEHETNLRRYLVRNNKLEWEDKFNRSYGILKHARKVSTKEAMDLLSSIRMGYAMNLLEQPIPDINFYEVIMNLRSGNIQLREKKSLTEEERDIKRAEYLRNVL